MTATRLKIDFVSDIVCPWCAVGLGALEQALSALGGEVQAEVHFQPFQLNPAMGPQGQDIVEHLAQKYGLSAEQQAVNWRALCERAAQAGFHFRQEGRGRTWNTFDAHRLLHWAGEVSPAHQRALKRALLQAYFERGENVSDPKVLQAAAVEAGLDGDRAAALLAGDAFADAVRDRLAFYSQAGIQAVPSVIVNDQYLIQGGQPAEAFEQALRQIAGRVGA